MQRAQCGERATYRASWTPADQPESRVFDTTLVPDIAACGEVRGVFGIAFDVTDYERREAELRAARDRADAANRAKSVFLATMSHELRTPLNAINGYAEILHGELFGPLGNPRYAEYAGDIFTSGRYLRDLIEGVLSLSSIEAGKQDLRIEPIHLGDLLYEVHRMLARKAQAKGITVTVDIPDAAIVDADPRAIKQVVTNTLENAVKFTPEGGQVDVSAISRGDGWALLVRDTGCGIPGEHLGRITEPFYRGVEGVNGLVTSASGTGIGLALVDRYLRAMDGSLEIDSQVGEGTCVTMTLPTPGAPTHVRRAGPPPESAAA
jgi:two-component system cell cycle sensor histidine kinase PleC